MGRGIDSRNRVWNWVAKLHRLVGRYNNPMPTWFLAPFRNLNYQHRRQSPYAQESIPPAYVAGIDSWAPQTFTNTGSDLYILYICTYVRTSVQGLWKRAEVTKTKYFSFNFRQGFTAQTWPWKGNVQLIKLTIFKKLIVKAPRGTLYTILYTSLLCLKVVFVEFYKVFF